MPEEIDDSRPEDDSALDDEDGEGQEAMLSRKRIRDRQRPVEDGELRDAIIVYFRERYTRKLTAEEAGRLLPAVRRKMQQLINVDDSGVREAISHVLQIRLLYDLPLVPLPNEA